MAIESVDIRQLRAALKELSAQTDQLRRLL
jgi:hypothetical protein